MDRVKKILRNCFWLSDEYGHGNDKKEIYAFNAMRFIAFFLIFSFHANRYMDISSVQQAHFGVAFFFIISGFLHGYLKKDIGKITFKSIAAYIKKKLSKIYPLFLFAILLMLPKAGLFDISNLDELRSFLSKLIPGVTMTSSWINSESHYFAFFSAIWYMGTFFFLIALTPIFLKIITKIRNSRRGAVKLLALACVLYGLSLLWVLAFKNEHYFTYIFPPARIFEYIIGIIFGSLMTMVKPVARFKKKVIVYSCMEIVSIVFSVAVIAISMAYGDKRLPGFLSTDMNLFTIPIILILCAFVQQKGIISYLLSNKPMVLFGRASMYLYLLHVPLLHLMYRNVSHRLAYGFFILIVTIIISVYLYSRSKKNENRPSRTQ